MSLPPTQALGARGFMVKALGTITPGMSLETPKIGEDVTEISAKHYYSDSLPLDGESKMLTYVYIDS
jgi:hypothetical protein